jgi:hypothetical protein
MVLWGVGEEATVVVAAADVGGGPGGVVGTAVFGGSEVDDAWGACC